jgi:limonene-1,2-epoxide hydrolase
VAAEQERVVREFLGFAEGSEQRVDAMVDAMAEEVVWQVNVPSWKPRVGRDACRAELERQNTISTGMLPGSEIVAMASTNRYVFAERYDCFAMGERKIALHINAVFEIDESDKIAAWREYYDSADLAAQLGVAVNFVIEK